MNRNLDWLGLAIEVAPNPVGQMTNPDDNQTYPRGCNFTRKLQATDNNSTGIFTHLYHSNKQETHIYLLNTIIDMIINLSEKFKKEFTETHFNTKIRHIKELVKAVEHLITQDNQIEKLRVQNESLASQLEALRKDHFITNEKLEHILHRLTKVPSKHDVKELIEIPKKVEEQTLQLITQISADADNRLDLIKRLIEQFHKEWLG